MTARDKFLDLVLPLSLQNMTGATREEFAEIRSLAIKNNVFMLVYSMLKKLSDARTPGPGTAEFLKNNESLYLSGLMRSMRLEAEENRLTALLGSEGIPAVVFKGNALAREVYGDPNCRLSEDIDILVRLKDAAEVDRLLLGSGYEREYERPLEFFLFRIHHAAYRSPGSRTLIEVHWNFAVQYFFNLSSDEIWGEIKPQDSGYTLSPEMTLIMLLAHHHSHCFRQFRVLVDVLWALDRYGRVIDWDRFFRRTGEIGLRNVAFVTFSQLAGLWGRTLEEFPFVSEYLENFRRHLHPLAGLVARHFMIDVDRPAHPGYLDKIAKRFALDGCGRIVGSFSGGLFPPLESLRQFESGRGLPVSYGKYLRWLVRCWLG